jgi:hypothetical protein
MEAMYVNNNPIYLTVGALIIFAFTSAVFVGYDCMVERRQRNVMKTVVRTNALLLENARMAAIAERELNDYIAYVARVDISCAFLQRLWPPLPTSSLIC